MRLRFTLHSGLGLPTRWIKQQLHTMKRIESPTGLTAICNRCRCYRSIIFISFQTAKFECRRQSANNTFICLSLNPRFGKASTTLRGSVYEVIDEFKYANLQIICQTYGLLLKFYHVEPLIFTKSAQCRVLEALLFLYFHTINSER